MQKLSKTDRYQIKCNAAKIDYIIFDSLMHDEEKRLNDFFPGYFHTIIAKARTSGEGDESRRLRARRMPIVASPKMSFTQQISHLSLINNSRPHNRWGG